MAQEPRLKRLTALLDLAAVHAPAPRRATRGPLTAGYFNPIHPSPIAVLGSAGLAWLDRQAGPPPGAALARAGLQFLIVADGAAPPAAIASWAKAGIAVASSQRPAAELVCALRQACAELQAPRKSLHGVLVEVFGLGVLVLGPSAAGKSALALELLTRGHRLVADDVVDLRRPVPGLLLGESPTLLRGHLHVRSLGVLSAPRMFGVDAVSQRARVDLIVRLERRSARRQSAAERLGSRRRTQTLLGVKLPALSLATALGHNLALLVETACRDTWLRLAGENSAAAFAARQQHAIQHSKTP